MDVISTIKIRNADGTYSDSMPIGTVSDYITVVADGSSLSSILGNVNLNKYGSLQSQINALGGGSGVADGVVYVGDDPEDTGEVPIEKINGISFDAEGDVLMAYWEHEGAVMQAQLAPAAKVETDFATKTSFGAGDISIPEIAVGAPPIGLKIRGYTQFGEFTNEETLYNPITINAVSANVNTGSVKVGAVFTSNYTWNNVNVILPPAMGGIFGIPLGIAPINSAYENNGGKFFIDSDNMCWAYDEINFETGKIYQRINRITFNGSDDEVITKINDDENDWRYKIKLPIAMPASPYQNGYCNRISRISKVSIIDAFGNGLDEVCFTTSFGSTEVWINIGYYMAENTIEEFKNIINQYPLIFYYPIAGEAIKYNMLEADYEAYHKLRMRDTRGFGVLSSTAVEVSYPVTSVGMSMALSSRKQSLIDLSRSYVNKLLDHFGRAMPWSYKYVVIIVKRNTNMIDRILFPLEAPAIYGSRSQFSFSGYVCTPTNLAAPSDLSNVVELVNTIISSLDSSDLIYQSNTSYITINFNTYQYYSNYFASWFTAPVPISLNVGADGFLRWPTVLLDGTINYGKPGQIMTTDGYGAVNFIDNVNNSTELTDDLTTDNSTIGLSAKGGKLLQDQINEINESLNSENSTYADQIYETTGINKETYPYILAWQYNTTATGYVVYIAESVSNNNATSVNLTNYTQYTKATTISESTDLAAITEDIIDTILSPNKKTTGILIAPSVNNGDGFIYYSNFALEDFSATNHGTIYRLDGNPNEVYVPTKVSELENDAGYITNPDPTDYAAQIYASYGIDSTVYPYIYAFFEANKIGKVTFAKTALGTNKESLGDVFSYYSYYCSFPSDYSNLSSVTSTINSLPKTGVHSTSEYFNADIGAVLDGSENYYAYTNYDIGCNHTRHFRLDPVNVKVPITRKIAGINLINDISKSKLKAALGLSTNKNYISDIYKAAGLNKDEYPYLYATISNHYLKVYFATSLSENDTNSMNIGGPIVCYYSSSIISIDDISDIDAIYACILDVIKTNTSSNATSAILTFNVNYFYYYTNFNPTDYGVTITQNHWILSSEDESVEENIIARLNDIESRLIALESAMESL